MKFIHGEGPKGRPEPKDQAHLPVRCPDGSFVDARIDEDDFDRLWQIYWRVGSGGYVWGSGPGGIPIALHREVLGCTRGDGTTVDHINHDRLDNRKSNLRLVTAAANVLNKDPRSKNNKTGFLNVYRRGDRFVAVTAWRKQHDWHGSFATAEEASRVATAARERYICAELEETA